MVTFEICLQEGNGHNLLNHCWSGVRHQDFGRSEIMDGKNTFSGMGEGFINKEVTPEEFISFFKSFKVGMLTLKEEFKNKIEPAIYFNPDNKKLAEKSAAFMSIFDEIERGIASVEDSLNNDQYERFEDGYRLILSSTEKLNALREEIVGIMKTMTPM